MHRRRTKLGQKNAATTGNHAPNDSAFASTLDHDEAWPPQEPLPLPEQHFAKQANRLATEPEELHSPHSFNFLSSDGTLDGLEDCCAPPKWEKVLWKEQPYPDNYTDATFLQELVSSGLRQQWHMQLLSMQQQAR